MGFPEEESLLGLMFSNPGGMLSVLEQASLASHTVTSLAVGLNPNTGLDSSNISETILVPPRGFVGIALNAYLDAKDTVARVRLFKDDVMILSINSPSAQRIEPLPNVWLPFRNKFLIQYTNSHPYSSATGCRALIDTVYIRTEVWDKIKSLFSHVTEILGRREQLG